MDKIEYNNIIEEKKKIFEKTISIGKRLQNTRKEIARPYVQALENQFPEIPLDTLIKIADKDLYKSNSHYQKLTDKLTELERFNQGPFQTLTKVIHLIRQSQF